MPRKAVEAPHQPPPPAPVVIDPNGVFQTDTVRSMLGLKQSSLRREVRERRLRVCRRCGKHFFLGSHLLAWLAAGEVS
jgi:hypothetical protein